MWQRASFTFADNVLHKRPITNPLENGAPIEKVQKLAGHADIRTTLMYYRQSV